MRWAELDSRTCSLARTLEIVGQPRTLLVPRDLFNGIRGFDDPADHSGIARNVLAHRLTGNGLAQRVPYRQAGYWARHEYHLASAGLPLPLSDRVLSWPCPGARRRGGPRDHPRRTGRPGSGGHR